ncbi:histidine kinase dimerization/phospho-acceptor domain-containing protein [Lichenihabitans sp. Uapishka_5]|uniref:sensor histidine kinase n=1 Tax=Lichenihabitans sp. Uapishka_5 TaxID=3037302 RepID=UPI0029E7D440|nr:ATP-binding protein [Lichenihabitans sp. Uapishka_5]MDX7952788.1 histidine kinase dimerization/phospho-acceptor domain-containing protein [Lichenihabitans sp. Uapishka_5]
MKALLDTAQAMTIVDRLGFAHAGEAPLVLVDRGSMAVLWANAAAAAALGSADATALTHRLFGSGLLAQRLRRLPRAGAGYRLERLPVPDQAQPLVLACHPIEEAGRALVLLDLRGGPVLAAVPVAAAPVGDPPGVIDAAIVPEPVTVAPVAPEPDAALPSQPDHGQSDRQPVTRILWETDAEGRLTEIGPEARRFLGATAPQVGDTLAECLRDAAPTLADRLATAARDGNSLALSRFEWPVAAPGPQRLVEIGCVPKRSGPGLRGVLTVHGAALPAERAAAPEPDATPAIAAPDDAPDAPEAEPRAETVATPEPEVFAAAAEPVAASGSPAEPTAPTPPGINNVVSFPLLRLGSVPANFVPAMRPAPASAAAKSTDVADVTDLAGPLWSEAPAWSEAIGGNEPDDLTADERDAFEHIRKVLGNRPLAPPPAVERSPAPQTGPGLASLQALLDRVPIGLRLDFDGATLLNDALTALVDPDAATAPVSSDRSLPGRNGAPIATTVSRFDIGGAPATLVVADPMPLAAGPQPFDGLDLVTDGHLRIDEAGLLAEVSPKAARLLGRDVRTLLGQPFTPMLADGQAAHWQALAASAAGPESPPPSPLRLRGSAGQPVAVLARLGRHKGGLVCALTLDRPVAAPANDTVEAARREAERTSALKSEFLAKVSHEIRTPLNAILGFTEVIRDERLGPVGNARYLEYLRDIHASGTHVMSLVNDLLDLSRIEAGRMDLRLEAVDANAIVQSCVNTLQTLALRERVIVRLSLTPRLPRTLADERSLRQIVLNLLSNAVKFNEPGGQVIVSTALARPDAVAIRIRDTGIGMTEDEIAAAMEPFRQLSTVNRTGSGLGLPLTKALVEANCASMSIKSTRGEGTLVEVTFPLVEQDAMSQPAE